MPNSTIQEVHENFVCANRIRPIYANHDWPLKDGRGVVTVEPIQRRHDELVFDKDFNLAGSHRSF